MNQLSRSQRAAMVRALVEGNSVRAVCRMTGAGKGTVLRLLSKLGTACAQFHDAMMRDLPCKRIQCDELWSFVGCKDRNIPKERRGQQGIGSAWTWIAMDPDSKLVVSWLIGDRSVFTAWRFMRDLAPRLRNRVQLTTDGHRAYLGAVSSAFGGEVDYAMLVKLYGPSPEGETRYSPPVCLGTRVERISGKPKRRHISTSFIERQNLTVRMGMRRFTRLTNGFSKKIDNMQAAVALHFVYYNFCRVHQTLKKTPAMAAGIVRRQWDIEDLIRLLEPATIRRSA